MAHAVLEAVYLESGERGPVVAIEPRPEFAPLFRMLALGDDRRTRHTCDIIILRPGAQQGARLGGGSG